MKRPYVLLLVAGTAVTGLLALVLLLPLGRAGATDGAGVSSTIVSRGTTDRHVRVRTKQPTDLVFARVTLQPDGYTGWHTHPGPLLVVVESGTLTRYDSDCDARAYATGQAFTEPAGRRHVHMGVNKTSTPVVLDITYVVPAGGPLRDDASAPKCAAGL
jgi:quercetin dioxygenase-like cupin family protein